MVVFPTRSTVVWSNKKSSGPRGSQEGVVPCLAMNSGPVLSQEADRLDLQKDKGKDALAKTGPSVFKPASTSFLFSWFFHVLVIDI